MISRLYLLHFFLDHGTLRLQSRELRARLKLASEIAGNIQKTASSMRGIGRSLSFVGVDVTAAVLKFVFWCVYVMYRFSLLLLFAHALATCVQRRRRAPEAQPLKIVIVHYIDTDTTLRHHMADRGYGMVSEQVL